MSRAGHRSALGAGGDVFPVSATAGGPDVVVRGDLVGLARGGPCGRLEPEFYSRACRRLELDA